VKRVRFYLLTTTATSLLAVSLASAAHKQAKDSLSDYLQRLEQPTRPVAVQTQGSLWRDDGRLAQLASDYKASKVGDLVTVEIVQDTTAQNSSNVATDRSFKSQSGIDSLPGRIKTGGIQNLFSPHSSTTLQGKAQAVSKSSLRTSVQGQVVAVLATGALVIEAERSIVMNNERQTVLLRGVARLGDIGPDNAVLSNNLSHLEVELKGKGVISDGTRQPNAVVRLLLKLLAF
jgi:flagellar L-ring protein FlgH